jgi:hypothetical protein
VTAGLVAELAHVDLKDGDAGGMKRKEPGLAKPKVKGRRTGRAIKNFKLFGRRGQRAASAKQRQGHLTTASVWSALDGGPADGLPGSIQDCEVRSIPVRLQHGQSLGTDLKGLSPSIDVLIVIGRFQEGAG